jgi:hypothetical protein
MVDATREVRHETAQTGTPPAVRRWIAVGVAAILLSALGLIAVRGEAIVLDLASLSKWALCL